MPQLPDVSTNWRRNHPWAITYRFIRSNEAVARPLTRLLFGTDLGVMDDYVTAIADVPAGGSVLDVPCGGGIALRGLKPGQDVRYVAADIAPLMLERTAAAAEAAGLEVETRSENVEELSFEDGTFDLGLSLLGLHCFPNPDRAIAEIARVIKPGGAFVGSVFANDGARYTVHRAFGRAMGVLGPSGTRDEIDGWMTSAGLENIAWRISGPIAYFRATRAA